MHSHENPLEVIWWLHSFFSYFGTQNDSNYFHSLGDFTVLQDRLGKIPIETKLSWEKANRKWMQHFTSGQWPDLENWSNDLKTSLGFSNTVHLVTCMQCFECLFGLIFFCFVLTYVHERHSKMKSKFIHDSYIFSLSDETATLASDLTMGSMRRYACVHESLCFPESRDDRFFLLEHRSSPIFGLLRPDFSSEVVEILWFS